MGSDDPVDVVTRFCAAWKAGDAGALVEFLTEDASYQNMMDEPCTGRERIREVFASFFRLTPAIEFTIRSMAGAGSVVLTERVDICTTTEGVTAHLPIAGVFELREGRIAAWRDYYDTAQFRRLLRLAPGQPA